MLGIHMLQLDLRELEHLQAAEVEHVVRRGPVEIEPRTATEPQGRPRVLVVHRLVPVQVLHQIQDENNQFIWLLSAVFKRGEVYQVCWGRISSCEEEKVKSRLRGRIKQEKAKGKAISSSL